MLYLTYTRRYIITEIIIAIAINTITATIIPIVTPIELLPSTVGAILVFDKLANGTVSEKKVLLIVVEFVLITENGV